MIDSRHGRAGTGRKVLLLSLLLCMATSAEAWNAAGHRLVACIAWGQLDERERLIVGDLLLAHPDRTRWSTTADDSDRSAFIEASTWADEIRYDPRFYDAAVDEPTPLRAGFPDMQRHRDWHYVNRPINGLQQHTVQSGRIDHQLVALQRALASVDRPTGERAYALPWLIHLVGDAHQPLHVGVRLNSLGKRDKTDDGEQIINPYNPRKRRSTLHAFWDDLPGPSSLRRKPLEETCQALAVMYSRPTPSTPARWIEESWQLAKSSGYPPSDENIPVISAEFQQTAREIGRQRIAEAGYRLANALRDAFSRRGAD